MSSESTNYKSSETNITCLGVYTTRVSVCKGPVTLQGVPTALARRLEIYQSAARSQEKCNIFHEDGVGTAISRRPKSCYGAPTASHRVSTAFFLAILCAFVAHPRRLDCAHCAFAAHSLCSYCVYCAFTAFTLRAQCFHGDSMALTLRCRYVEEIYFHMCTCIYIYRSFVYLLLITEDAKRGEGGERQNMPTAVRLYFVHQPFNSI